MQNMNQMKNISGFISRALFVLFVLTLFGQVSAQEISAKDTLRTFGPRFGIDLARFIYIFTTFSCYRQRMRINYHCVFTHFSRMDTWCFSCFNYFKQSEKLM